MTLKIERISSKDGTRIRMSGELRSDQLDEVKAEIERGATIALDLEEVDLVDVESVRFLNARESEGISVVHCSPYIREWMRREQAGQKEPTGLKSEEGERK
ncbi:MAG: hypothetical protein ACRD20_08180 [Terriglobales bacterium]